MHIENGYMVTLTTANMDRHRFGHLIICVYMRQNFHKENCSNYSHDTNLNRHSDKIGITYGALSYGGGNMEVMLLVFTK